MTSKCPVVHDFEPFETSGGIDLVPELALARRETPIFYMPAHDMYAVTRMDDVIAVLRDFRRFNNDPMIAKPDVPEEVIERMWPGYTGPGNPDTLGGLNPPRHTRVRRLQQPFFAQDKIDRLRPIAERYADELVDAFAADGQAELVDQLAGPFVVGVISDWLGLQPQFRLRMREYALANLRQTVVRPEAVPEEERAADWRILSEFDAAFVEHIESRRREPADDLTSELLALRDDEGNLALADKELWAAVVGLAVAASHTTANALCHAVHLLLTHRDQWDALLADRSLVPAAVEETLRYRDGLTGGTLRQAVTDVEVGGVEIPEGAVLYLLINSANRDDGTFAAPDEFNVFREDAGRHIGFGTGIHKCVGAPLARLEMTVGLERLLDRFPDLRLADPEAELVYIPNMIVAELQELNVVW
jgi:cytochrome P450